MEKLLTEKKHMIKMSVIAVICCVLSAGIIFGTMQYKSSIEDDLKIIKDDTSKISNKIRNLEQNRKSSQEAYKRFKNINTNRRPSTDNYTTSVSRQIVAKSILTKLSDKYKFTNIFPRLTPPEVSKDHAVEEGLEIIASTLSLRFEGMSDELVYAFIEEAQENFPGYLKLTRLNISRKGDIDPDIINKIKVTNSYLPLISGTLDFKWYTVSNITEGEVK